MNHLIPDEKVLNPSADAPWKKSERDRLLDLYFEGALPKRLAQELKRNPKGVERYLQAFEYNENDKALRYEPLHRTSRKGKRWTENERKFRNSHLQRKVPEFATAKLLCRPVEELAFQLTSSTVKTLTLLAPRMDLIMALRYAYHVYHVPLVSDAQYDDMVEEEREFGGGRAAFGKDVDPKWCSPRVKTLALYLYERWEEEKKEDKP